MPEQRDKTQLLADDDGIRRSATLSPNGRYRYNLNRMWEGSGYRAVFVMLNPSTADDRIDDPTIRRCMGFARAWDYSWITVLNLYAWRATDPKELWKADRPVGEGKINDAFLRTAALECAITGEPLIAAWGVNAKPDRVADAQEIVRTAGMEFTCLGVTKDGHPRHPLYLPRAATPTPWPKAMVA